MKREKERERELHCIQLLDDLEQGSISIEGE